MSDSIFLKIIRRELPAKIVYETEQVIAFHDIHPQAPVHILIVPKKLIPNIAEAESADQAILGELMLAVGKIAKEQGLPNGFRVVVNKGKEGGETVPHLHLHLLGGRQLRWPPG